MYDGIIMKFISLSFQKSSTSSSCTTVITTPSSAATITAPKITDMKVKNCRKNPSLRGSVINCRTESVLSTDSDIRFTRKKLGDNQRCGCALIAGFLIILLLAGTIVYLGCEYKFIYYFLDSYTKLTGNLFR